MKKLQTMTKILIGLAIFLITFTITMIIIFIVTGQEMPTLITSVFAICGGECGVMGWIRTTKDRQREREYDLADRGGDSDHLMADRNDENNTSMGGNV